MKLALEETVMKVLQMTAKNKVEMTTKT